MRRIHTLPLARLTWFTAAALGLGLAASAARTADKEPVYSATVGKVTYGAYCANCHGSDGRGAGEIAPTLVVKPTNLTRLAAENDGVFPAERMHEVVDGRADVTAHGRREMPVWGDTFVWPEEDSPKRREQVERKIGELVAYLRSIQEPVEKR